jgi:CheY-like chemotaxis protein
MPYGGTLTLSAHALTPDRCGLPTDGSILFTSALEATCYVRVSIADTGLGMTPDVLARVTEPFFTTKPAGKGTGLGLAMAKGFAEQSGGGLGIASAPGQGTRIDLWLPVAEGVDAVEAPMSETVHPPAVGGGKRILVVDDDELVRRFVADHLRDEGYEVVTAPDGPGALAVMDDGETIDLVVCDLSMPRMNGVDVIAQMHLRNADLPAILLTGFATQAAQLAAKALTGAFVLLHKPVSEENLSAHVAMLLEA